MTPEELARWHCVAESGERGNCLDPKNPGHLSDHARTPQGNAQMLYVEGLERRITALEEEVAKLKADRRGHLQYSG